MSKDLHLSAYSIDSDVILSLERYGFERDPFINNTRCDVTAYHGTYRGASPESQALWDTIVDLLEADLNFSGSLELENFVASEAVYFPGSGIDCKKLLPVPTDGGRDHSCKLCDIHIAIDLKDSSAEAISVVSSMQIASFDKISNGREVRIFSITTNCVDTGAAAFKFLAKRLGATKGLYGKIKFETTDRIYRHPKDAPMLPLSKKEALLQWVLANES